MKLFSATYVERVLFVALVAMTLVKGSLMGAGFFALNDEFRYRQAGAALEHWSRLEIRDGIENLFSAKGRPGEILVKVVPTAIQVITAKVTGQEVYALGNSYPIFFFNYAIYGLILLFLYRIALRLLGGRIPALFSVLAYSALTNSHLYLRHAFPYDTSLLLLLFVLYQVVVIRERDEVRYSILFFLGFLAFFAYTVYPGYVLLYFASPMMLALVGLTRAQVLPRFIQTGWFGLGSTACLAVIEGLSRVAGISYIEKALSISSQIKEGSFDESLIFIVRYLTQVEGVTGVIFLLGFAGAVLAVIRLMARRKVAAYQEVILLMVGLTALFLAYAGAGYFFQKVVLYGRLLHQFFPFMALFVSFAVLVLISRSRVRHGVYGLLALIMVVNFAVSFGSYTAYTYPRDVATTLAERFPASTYDFYCSYRQYFSSEPTLPSDQFATLKTPAFEEPPTYRTITLVNGCFAYPLNDPSLFAPYEPSMSEQRIDSSLHFMKYKAYQFEGYNPSERAYFDQIPFSIDVYAE